MLLLQGHCIAVASFDTYLGHGHYQWNATRQIASHQHDERQ